MSPSVKAELKEAIRVARRRDLILSERQAVEYGEQILSDDLSRSDAAVRAVIVAMGNE